MSFEAYLPPGIGIEDLIVAMAATAALLTCLGVYTALIARAPGARRAQRLTEYRRDLRATALRRPERARLVPLSLIRRAIQRLGLLRGHQNAALATKLAHAGWRSKDAVIRFLFFKLALPFAFGGGTALMLYGFDAYQLAPLSKLGVALAAVLAGSYAPELYVKNREGKRANALRKSLPDGIDLMVICAEAGLSLDATFARVAGELGPAAPELADEMEQTTL
jgi:tight adherence protein C